MQILRHCHNSHDQIYHINRWRSKGIVFFRTEWRSDRSVGLKTRSSYRIATFTTLVLRGLIRIMVACQRAAAVSLLRHTATISIRSLVHQSEI